MKRYLVLDLDGTLAPIGKPSAPETVESLKRLEKAGWTIVLCSGKPTFYLVGFARQLGLKAPVFIGENGYEIVYGIDLPPRKILRLPADKAALRFLSALKEEIGEKLGKKVWFQPATVVLTPFFKDRESKDEIFSILALHEKTVESLHICVLPQCDCFDILPPGVDKGKGLKLFLECEKGLNGGEEPFALSVGDGINDLTMFAASDKSIGVGRRLTGKTDDVFDSIGEALSFIEHF